MNADFLNNCFGLDGRTVVVTGAGSGLGRQAALTLSAAGAHVALLGRRQDALEGTASMVREQAGQATVYPTDVSDEAAVEVSLDAICAQCPPLWGLVNNAGVGGRFLLTQAHAASVHKILEVNTVAALLMASGFARRLINQKSPGRIVNICSLAAEKHSQGLGVYGASKAALEHLSRTMAYEWASAGINVNTINPGFIETDINRAMFQTPAGQAIVQALPRKRLGIPQALDTALLMLMAPASQHITGATLTVDDGQKFGAS